MEAGALIVEPHDPRPPTVLQYRCRTCDVAGRSEDPPHRCWACGGTAVEFHRSAIRDQSISNASWAMGERVDRLIERSA